MLRFVVALVVSSLWLGHAIDIKNTLEQAVHGNSLGAVQAALNAGADINQIMGAGQTPLMAATLGGHVEIVQFLLQKGANPEIPEKQGYTPMHGAAFQGRAEVAEALINYLNPSHQHDGDGFRPIHRACWGKEPRHTATVKVFLEAGVKHDEEAKDGSTPLTISRQVGNQGTIDLLLQAERAARNDSKAPVKDDEL